MSEAGTRYTVETGRSGLTYEDYCARPVDGLRYEIVDGMLFAEPSPQEAAAVACDDEFRPGVFPGLAISLPILFA